MPHARIRERQLPHEQCVPAAALDADLRNRAFRAALGVLDRTVYGIIEERRQQRQDRHDLLGLLMAACDEDGSKMTYRQLRDELVNLLLAGHETTAAALSWTWFLLARASRGRRSACTPSLTQALDGRAPGVDDLAHLPFTERVLQESMRLYPPAWGMARQAVAEDEIGGYRRAEGRYIGARVVPHAPSPRVLGRS